MHRYPLCICISVCVVALAVLSHRVDAVDMLLIPDSTNDAVHRFDPDNGDYLGVVISDPEHLSRPIDVAINVMGIVVSDQIEGELVQYSMSGRYLGPFAKSVSNVRGLATHGGVLYAAAGGANSVVRFDQETGAKIGDFIGPAVGGLDGPFDILFRERDVLVTSTESDNVLRYDHAGVPLGSFARNIPFGEQMRLARNGNVLVVDLTRDEVVELDPSGREVDAYGGVSAPRGCYELPDGNLLVTGGTGVHVIARPGGGILSTKLAGISARFIEPVELGATPIEPATWGGIKLLFH